MTSLPLTTENLSSHTRSYASDTVAELEGLDLSENGSQPNRARCLDPTFEAHTE